MGPELRARGADRPARRQPLSWDVADKTEQNAPRASIVPNASWSLMIACDRRPLDPASSLDIVGAVVGVDDYTARRLAGRHGPAPVGLPDRDPADHRASSSSPSSDAAGRAGAPHDRRGARPLPPTEARPMSSALDLAGALRACRARRPAAPADRDGCSAPPRSTTPSTSPRPCSTRRRSATRCRASTASSCSCCTRRARPATSTTWRRASTRRSTSPARRSPPPSTTSSTSSSSCATASAVADPRRGRRPPRRRPRARGRAARRRASARGPRARRADVDRDAADARSAERLYAVVIEVAEILRALDRSPARELAKGGLALPETRRLAEAARLDVDDVADAAAHRGPRGPRRLGPRRLGHRARRAPTGSPPRGPTGGSR